MKHNRLGKLGEFVLGKGFYIVLFLCVAAIGISGYFLIDFVNVEEESKSVTANPSITLPDSSASVTTPKPEQETKQETTETEKPVQESMPDDPEAVEPTQETPEAPEAQQEERKPVVYTWPVKGEILRTFSLETLSYDVTMGDWRTHNGIDISAEAGWNVMAAGEGQVVDVYEDALMGVTVVVQQPDGVVATYSNLASNPPVSVGDAVDTGSILGQIGDTAIAESGLKSHLHLEMTADEQAVDPLNYLPEK